jgi:CubicO group peptidase (beta-lactamase class C family)
MITNKYFQIPSVIFISLLLFVTLSYGQELPTANPEELGFSSERLARIDEVFSAYVENEKMAGSVILVARKGKVGYFKAFGQRDIAAGAPMKKDVIFRIASQTKAIISVGIMILQEEGKLLIQDPLSQYIPAFKETTVAVPDEEGGYEVVKANRPITLRDLLTHTAGIGYGTGLASDAWEEAGIQGWYFADRDEPIAETVNRMAALPMDAQPGTKWVYGYAIDILGVVIEKASGMPLDAFLKDRIFEPLGMTDTHFYLPKDQVDRLATVYTPKEGEPLKPAPKEGTMNSQGAYVDGPRKSFSGGAGLLSTAKDYYLFLQMLANGGELNGHRILSSRTVDLMTTNHLGDDVDFRPGQGFGLGFDVVLDPGKRGTYGSVGQYGWGGAYGSTYWVDPAEELVVVYFTQLRPSSIVKDQLMLRTLVYQALVD